MSENKESKRFREAEKMAHEIKRGMYKKLMSDFKELRKSRPRQAAKY
ncbi:MAG: hypothetical protein AABX14_02845 [Candidatus Aenigmatarchaeota archaeon]